MAKDELVLYVYNTAFQMTGIIDQYYSLIWSDRFCSCGDFEIRLPYRSDYKDIFKKDHYCRIRYSDRTMIIEQISIESSESAPATITVTGRSLESILERRIILNKTEFGSDVNNTITEVSVQDSIKKLLDDNIISPLDTNRKISNFKFQASTNKKITDLQFHDSYDKDNLLDVIQNLCEDKHIGYKVVQNSSNQFVFSLYQGVDRSNENDTTSYVIFSPYYDNLKRSSYLISKQEFKNLMYVSLEKKYKTNAKGEQEEIKRPEYLEVPRLAHNKPTGLNRREIHANENDLKESNETSLTQIQVIIKARRKLKNEHKEKTGFEGDIVPDLMYQYRTHYYIGDRVYFEDKYKNSQTLYISEVVISSDESGFTILPTFEDIDWVD